MTESCCVLLAAGGHGRVALNLLLDLGIQVEGIVDPGKVIGSAIFGVPILGGDEWLENMPPSDFILVNGVGVAPGNYLRKCIYTYWKQRGFEFLSLVHPFSVISRETVISEGVQIMAGSVLQCGVSVGENVVINTRASVDHDTNIGVNAFIGPGATLCGEVCIGEDVFVGAGSVIMPGVSVGDKAVIGAGAVVTRNVPEGFIMVGNPAVSSKNNIK